MVGKRLQIEESTGGWRAFPLEGSGAGDPFPLLYHIFPVFAIETSEFPGGKRHRYSEAERASFFAGGLYFGGFYGIIQAQVIL